MRWWFPVVVALLACTEQVRVPGGAIETMDTSADWHPPGDSASGEDDSGGDSGDTSETGDTAGGVDTADTGAPAKAPGIVLFIGDGMGFEHVRGAGMYANGASGSLVMESLPAQGRLRTASLSGTTDSAASATAMATGAKTYNDMLGLDRDGVSVENLVERARSAGMSVGVVTTDKLTGATPAGFVVHIEDRGDAANIADAFGSNLPDVLLGGSHADFEPLLATLAAQVVADGTALTAAVADGRPLLGLFAETTFPYVADGYPVGTPTLDEMTTKALEWLDDDPDGFFLMVESARVDHASHSMSEERVFDEVVALDASVAAALAWSGPQELTVVVTADHECGGLAVSGVSGTGVVPTSTWRWNQHTNADVPVFATGGLTSVFDGARLDQLWVHAVLAATIDGEPTVPAPSVPWLVDGETSDLGAVVAAQSWATSFGVGYNQLDALRVSADTDGLWVGVDGVYERGENSVLVLVDLDYGAGTGLGTGTELADSLGQLDGALTSLDLGVNVPGVGFDAAFGAVGAEEIGLSATSESAGLRGLGGGLGTASDFAWLDGISNFDDGNVASGSAAPDAGATGLTANGLEMLVPWSSVFPAGVPATGTTLAVVVLLVNGSGEYGSNQALPSFAASGEPGSDRLELDRVITLSVDGTGASSGAASVVP